MTQRVGIVAAAQTRFEASKEQLSNGELLFDVVERVVLETGVKFEDQDTSYNYDQTEKYQNYWIHVLLLVI